MTESGYVIDADTGEISDQYGVFKTHDVINQSKEFYKKEMFKNEKDILKLMGENKSLKKRLGNYTDEEKLYSSFIWSYFHEQQNLFPCLKAKDISRLIFLSTYCNYKTNVLVANGIPLHKGDLRKLMNLTRSVYNPWIEKMIHYKYISFSHDNVIINKNFFSRGQLIKKDDVKAIRLFIDIVQELYFNLKPDDHHKMGLVMKLIPYINPYFNCLAKNPYEKEREKLIPLKLGELAEKLGYSIKQSKRLGNEILSIHFGNDKKRIAIAVALDSLKPENYILMFNSKLFFGGNVDEYRLVNNIFDNYKQNDLFNLSI